MLSCAPAVQASTFQEIYCNYTFVHVKNLIENLQRIKIYIKNQYRLKNTSLLIDFFFLNKMFKNRKLFHFSEIELTLSRCERSERCVDIYTSSQIDGLCEIRAHSTTRNRHTYVHKCRIKLISSITRERERGQFPIL